MATATASACHPAISIGRGHAGASGMSEPKESEVHRETPKNKASSRASVASKEGYTEFLRLILLLTRTFGPRRRIPQNSFPKLNRATARSFC